MPDTNLKNATVLIVDDELANVRMLEMLLQDWGCTNAHSTTDSREAVGIFTEFRPDLILLDLMMPEIDGFGVMGLLQPLIPEGDFLPILVLTADSSTRTRHKALAVGATDFLTKPFDVVELSLRVSNLLRTRFLHLQLQNQNQILDAKVEERTKQLADKELETIECLALAAEYRDDDTGQHTMRVGHFAAQLAQFLGLPKELVKGIRHAAPLHDVGKIGIPDSILLKPGRLTPEEFKAMQEHAAIGASISIGSHRRPL